MLTSASQSGTGRCQGVWIPVPVRGLRLAFEMHPSGCVRKRVRIPGFRWLLPHKDLGGGRGWGYRLQHAAGCFELAASALCEAFGAEPSALEGQAEYALKAARRENRRELDAFLLAEPLCALLLEGEPRLLRGLAAALAAGCPWEWGRIQGDARGADPVLGF